MPKPKQPAADQSEQSKLFIEKAREIGADAEADATEVMRRLVSQKKPTPTKKSRKA